MLLNENDYAAALIVKRERSQTRGSQSYSVCIAISVSAIVNCKMNKADIVFSNVHTPIVRVVVCFYTEN